MECVKCKSGYIANRTYKLCSWCNHIRIHGETPIETQIRKKIERDKANYGKPKKLPKMGFKMSQDRKETLKKDREIYRKVFESSSHICEECSACLPTEFETESGKLIAVFRYSHILGKKAWPEYRHKEWNFNELCLSCHNTWDFGDKKSMKIYSKNKELILKKTGKELL